MNKEQAKKLLDETFNGEFDQQKFNKFLSELLNGFRVENRSLGVSKEYADYISEFKKIGEYSDGKKSMEILVVKLKKSTSLERARTMQRNFIAKWLSMGYEEKDGALVAFYGDDPYDWRFSFIKMDYRLVERDDGKTKTEKELTPAKRYSFLVGVNEPNHTCRSQFLDLVIEEKRNPSIQEIENAFSIEKVTKEFFLEYKELFSKLAKSLEKVFRSDEFVKKEFEEKNISVVDFSKKLLGQIVFIYFLQKKGWLGVEKDESGKFNEWGTGPKNFLKKLFDKKVVDYKNFFNEILEPLFYEALAKERDEDYYSRFRCKIPFLNGGLFEPINNYNWTKTEILLDNSIFKDILDTFDKYNFTIKEDEPLEKEVAVDPEMLGKVFESLLDVDDRKSKGAFYTPREIVHYMCQQSLVNYLETNSNLPKKDIEFFIHKGEFALDQLRRAQIDGYAKRAFILPDSIGKNAQLLDDLLKNIKIVDPAVGSGAFPVGMMNEVVRARTILTHFFKDKQLRTDYNLKRETIENSLYGVDIESSAVEITKLRFWLSLIVDELDMKNIKPLPNLDNKIMCGNSLVEEFEGIKLYKDMNDVSVEKQATLDSTFEKKRKESEKKLGRLRELQKDFFGEQNRKRKNELREEIDKIEWEFIEETLKEQGNEEAMRKLDQYKKNKSKPFFLWKLYFSDVFNKESPGFDVVIGNPPYIDYRKIDDSTKQGLSNFVSYQLTKTGSIYVYFIELGITLLKSKGTLVFINPYQYLTADSGYGIRKFAIDNHKISRIVDVSNIRVFAEASTYTCINFFLKDYDPENSIEIARCLTLDEIGKKGFFVKQSETKLDSYRINIAEDNKIINKLASVKNHLGDYCDIFCGTSAGGFGKKIIKQEEYLKLPEKQKSKYHIIVQSSNTGKYFFKELNKYITEDIYPSNVQKNFGKEKIFFARMTKDIRCTLTSQPYFGGKINVLVDFKINPKVLLALLNSKLISWWYYAKFESKHLSGGYLGFDIPSIKEIPLMEVSNDKQKSMIEIVDRIFSITESKDYTEDVDKQAMVKALEKRIDKIVYEIYDLNSEEIKIVEEKAEED